LPKLARGAVCGSKHADQHAIATHLQSGMAIPLHPPRSRKRLVSALSDPGRGGPLVVSTVHVGSDSLSKRTSYSLPSPGPAVGAGLDVGSATRATVAVRAGRGCRNADDLTLLQHGSPSTSLQRLAAEEAGARTGAAEELWRDPGTACWVPLTVNDSRMSASYGPHQPSDLSGDLRSQPTQKYDNCFVAHPVGSIDSKA
jgi:hypothetical protein